LLLLLLLLLVQINIIVNIEEFAVKWRELETRVLDPKGLDQLEVRVGEAAHAHRHQVEQLLQHLLLLEAGEARAASILHVQAQQLAAAVVGVVDGLEVVEVGVVRIEEEGGGEEGELAAAQAELPQLTHEVQVVVDEVALVLVECEGVGQRWVIAI